MEHIIDKTNKIQSQSVADSIDSKISKSKTLQDNRPSTILQKKANNTGLPNNLKSGIENLSGHAMDDVKVHYNSDKPAQLNAHAYAQGTDIHVASGQEKHLPHEAWHVVQQKQGRVKPTMQMKGKVNVNDDEGLEKEADVMGAKALQMKTKEFSKDNDKTVLKNDIGKVRQKPIQMLQQHYKPTLTIIRSPFQLKKLKRQSNIKSAISNSVIQRQPLKKKTEDNLVDAVKNNDKQKFKQIFRAAASGMDEMISCDVTFSQARSRLANETKMREFLRASHETRHPTHEMGHNVSGTGKKQYEFAHPTSPDKVVYTTKKTKKGNPRWIGHTGWDRARAKHVKEGKTIKEMQDRAIEFTLNSGAQPPFAKNSNIKRTYAEALLGHNDREKLKSKHSKYDPKKKQKINAQWEPNRAKRGVSPTRK
ncbi:eCIS core domain-containing protein [Flavobacterium sp.]|uniref:eCIS core domain-containing protein n=1 Tax=Flavobacterium sp. TaxID=239 RepID=UPI0040474A0F